MLNALDVKGVGSGGGWLVRGVPQNTSGTVGVGADSSVT